MVIDLFAFTGPSIANLEAAVEFGRAGLGASYFGLHSPRCSEG